jgi:LEA14-like dessication related protein
MKIEKAGFGKSVLALRIQYYNPNPFRVSLKSIKADVSLENKFLGTLVMDTLIMVPASADFGFRPG